MGKLLFKFEKYITFALVLAIAVILLGGLAVFAQGPGGTIVGVVKDASGAAAGLITTTSTDSREFQFSLKILF